MCSAVCSGTKTALGMRCAPRRSRAKARRSSRARCTLRRLSARMAPTSRRLAIAPTTHGLPRLGLLAAPRLRRPRISRLARLEASRLAWLCTSGPPWNMWVLIAHILYALCQIPLAAWPWRFLSLSLCALLRSLCLAAVARPRVT